MRPTRGSWLVVAITLAAGGARAGDPDVADLLLKKAKKAFAAKDYAEAETGFRRALKEMTPFPDARLGLAESLEKLARPLEAVEEYRTCVAEIDASGAPAKWKALRTRAQQAVSRLQARHAELAKLNDAFVRKCIDFGKKYAKSDPTWARKALDAALLLDPANGVARGLLKTLPAADAPVVESKPAKGKGESLFQRDFWNGSPEFSVDSDTITGDVRVPDGRLFWLDPIVLEGKYQVHARLRMTRDGKERRAFGMFFGGDGKSKWWSVVFDWNDQIVLERWDGSPSNMGCSMLSDHDHAEWHTLDIAVDRGSVKVSLDGKEVLAHDGTERSCFDGKICLFVQNACVEWQDLEVKR